MENASATSLYVQACKLLLNCGEDKSSWDQLMAVLPQLRNALTCRVCRGLIVDPLSSGYCQHYVCRACLQKKRALNPGCKWCLDFSNLRRSDEQIRVVLACYKLLCEAIKSSSYYVSRHKNLVVDNLLKEAKLNSDVLPNSSFVVSNNSRILEEKMADNVASRDQLKTCAREKVEVKTAVANSFNVEKTQESATNDILEHCDAQTSFEHLKPSMIMVERKNNQLQPNALRIKPDNTKYINCNNSNGVVAVEEMNGQLQPNTIEKESDNNSTNCTINAITLVEENAQLQPNAIKIETDNTNIKCSDQLDFNSVEMDSKGKDDSGEINNNGDNTHLVQKVKLKNKRACLRPRNGQLVQKFEAGRCMRKRKLVTQSCNQKNRPRKKYKIGY